MENHTLILSTAKVAIPEAVNVDFVLKLINRGLTLVEYFGPEIDNQADFIDPYMENLSNTISYFYFNFDTEETIEYDSLSEMEVDQILNDLITSSTNIEVRADEKNITFYL